VNWFLRLTALGLAAGLSLWVILNLFLG